MKIRPVGTEFFHADRRTDMTTLIITFRNFLNAPKKNPAAISIIPLLELMNILILCYLDTQDHCKLVEEPTAAGVL